MAYAFGYLIGLIIFGFVPLVAEVLIIIDACKSKQKSTKVAGWVMVSYAVLWLLLVVASL